MDHVDANHQLIKKSEKLATSQVNRLRKEEDEDQWISGEELNTDGSSDEESSGKRSERKSNNRSKFKTPSSAAMKRGNVKRGPPTIAIVPDPTSGGVLSPARNECKPMEKSVLYKDGPSCSNSLEIIDDELEEISWRPKRGSIKLPNLNAEGNLIDLLQKAQI